MESIKEIQKRAGQSMAYALRRQVVAEQTYASTDESDEREFPVIVKARTSLTAGEVSDLLDSILDEHLDTIKSLAK